jgi:nucleoporin NUP42
MLSSLNFLNEPYFIFVFLPKNARNNSAQAYDQAVKQSEIPARLAAASNTQPTTSAFGNNTNSTSALPSAFSNTNPTTLTFGQPTFGQPTFGQSAFGQPAFGQPAFGQPVQNPSTSATSTGPTSTGAFGQPLNNPGPVSAFGQAFGQPVQNPSTSATSTAPTPTGAFGQPLNNPGPVSAFGQPSFGQPSALGTSSFIKPASGAFSAFNNTESAFGNKTTPATINTGSGGFSAFATQPSAFSLAAKTTPTAGSTFGQPSFGQPAPVISVPTSLGNPAPAPTSVFGTPSAFGVLSQPQQPGQQQQQTAPVWPSDNNSFGNTTHYNSTFGTPTATLSTIPPTTKSSRTKSVFKPGSTPYDQQIPSNYKETLPKSVVKAFESQNFEWGEVPEWVPPVEIR